MKASQPGAWSYNYEVATEKFYGPNRKIFAALVEDTVVEKY